MGRTGTQNIPFCGDFDVNNGTWAWLIVEELVRNGVDLFCISPGARSTPLILAIARHDKAQSKIFYDERAAAYYAVGYSKALGKPAVLVSTSGTAVANYFPAIIEASKDSAPLIVLTADRPPELYDTGANQTIDQVKIFGDYISWYSGLPCPDEKIPAAMVLTTIDQLYYRSSDGPVHLNCMFRKPLEEPCCIPDDENIQRWLHRGGPYTHYSKKYTTIDDDGELAEIISHHEKGLFIVGGRANGNALVSLLKKVGWPIYLDIRARGLMVDHWDKYDYRPEIVIHFGDPVVSAKRQQWLEQLSLEYYVVVNDHPGRQDQGHCVTWHIESDINLLCQRLLEKVSKTHFSRQEACQYNDIIPDGWGIFIGNSMAIRHMDRWANFKKSVPIGTNRGASGIDGTVASAVGFAEGLRCPVVALIGDITALHDLNSFMLVQKSSYPVIVVIINDDGGGIFSLLPVVEHEDVFEQFFRAPHGCNFVNIARMFHLPYFESYSEAIINGKSAIVEINTFGLILM